MAVVFGISNFVWVFITLTSSAFFWLHIMGAGIIGVFSSSVTFVANLPFDMCLHPKSRFTQFCSAQTLMRSFGMMFAGVLGGLYFDSIKSFFRNSDFAYRFGFAWSAFWTIISSALIYRLYRQWHALGGDKHFHVPAPWSPTGFEEQEQSNYVGPQTKWLRIVMRTIRGVQVLSVLYLIPLSFWLWQKGWTLDVQWHLLGIFPISIALLVWWLFVERGLKNDIARCQAGESPRDGIPHHGILFIKSCALLLLLGIWFGKTIAAIDAGLEGGVLVLGAGNLITNALFILTFLLLRRMELGHDPLLVYDGHATAAKDAEANVTYAGIG